MTKWRQRLTMVTILTASLRLLLSLSVMLILFPAATEAGNPLFTNDPETPGARGWEINISHNIERVLGRRDEDLPLLNVNYGSTENNQWKISVPLRHFDPRNDVDQWGIGDIELGWKYRFIEEDEYGFMASVYPQPLLPTGNEARGIGDAVSKCYFLHRSASTFSTTSYSCMQQQT